jgi:hypothetical protein
MVAPFVCSDPLTSSHLGEFWVIGGAPVAKSRVRAPGVVAMDPGDDLLSCTPSNVGHQYDIGDDHVRSSSRLWERWAERSEVRGFHSRAGGGM